MMVIDLQDALPGKLPVTATVIQDSGRREITQRLSSSWRLLYRRMPHADCDIMSWRQSKNDSLPDTSVSKWPHICDVMFSQYIPKYFLRLLLQNFFSLTCRNLWRWVMIFHFLSTSLDFLLLFSNCIVLLNTWGNTSTNLYLDRTGSGTYFGVMPMGIYAVLFKVFLTILLLIVDDTDLEALAKFLLRS